MHCMRILLNQKDTVSEALADLAFWPNLCKRLLVAKPTFARFFSSICPMRSLIWSSMLSRLPNDETMKSKDASPAAKTHVSRLQDYFCSVG